MSDLRYRLTADAKKLQQTLKTVSPAFEKMRKKAEDQLDKLNKKFDLTDKKFTVAAAGATAFGAATAAAVKMSISDMDALQKAADRVGTSVENMAAAELAANRGGANLEQISVAMGKIAKEAKAGETSFEVFARYADEIQAMGPGASATARAIELFGEEGAKLTPILLKGSEGMRKAREDAERLGLTFDGRTGRQVEEFNDRLADFENLARGAARQLTSELVPGLNTYSDALLTASTRSRRLKEFMSGVATVTKVVATLAEGLATGFSLAGESIAFMMHTLVLSTSNVTTALAALKDDGPEAFAKSWIEGGERIVESFKRYRAEIGSIVDESNSRIAGLWGDGGPGRDGDRPSGPILIQGPSLDLFEDEQKRREERRKRYAEAEKEALSAAERIAKAVEEKQEELAERAAEARARRSKVFLSDINKELDNIGGEFADQDDRAAARLVKQVDKAGEEIEASFAEKARFVEGAAQAVGDGIADALFGPAEESLDAFLKRWLESIARMGISAAVGAIGGAVTPGFAEGGYVAGPGTGKSDSILARLSNGEYVLTAQQVKEAGRGYLDAWRKKGLAAADKYGPGTLKKLSSFQLPGRAEGGVVGGGGGADVTIANLFSEEELARFLAGRRGQRIIMNSIQRSNSLAGRGGG